MVAVAIYSLLDPSTMHYWFWIVKKWLTNPSLQASQKVGWSSF